MSESLQLADASVYVNDELIPIVPGSLKTPAAKGEVKSRFLSTGGSNGIIVSGLDTESMIDKVSFSVGTTPEALSRAEEWKQNTIDGSFNTIRLSWPKQKIIRSYTQARMDNAPEAEHSADGNFDLEFSALRSIG